MSISPSKTKIKEEKIDFKIYSKILKKLEKNY